MIDKSKIELGIIGVVAFVLILVSILAVKPWLLLKEARNATRISHMETILNAVYVYNIDNRGFFPPCIPSPGEEAAEITKCEELLPYLYKGGYPTDPRSNAKYMIEYSPEGENKVRVFSTAPEAKGVEIIR